MGILIQILNTDFCFLTPVLFALLLPLLAFRAALTCTSHFATIRQDLFGSSNFRENKGVYQVTNQRRSPEKNAKRRHEILMGFPPQIPHASIIEIQPNQWPRSSRSPVSISIALAPIRHNSPNPPTHTPSMPPNKQLSKTSSTQISLTNSRAPKPQLRSISPQPPKIHLPLLHPHIILNYRQISMQLLK